MHPAFIYAPYLFPYIVLFGIALVMPGRRSLTLLATLVGVPLAGLVFICFKGMEEAPGGAILGAAIMTGLVFCAAAGLWSGIATKAVWLWQSASKKSIVKTVAITLLGFTALPSLLATSMWYSKWSRRPPDSACMSATHHIKIDRSDFWLPSAPIFTVWTTPSMLYSLENPQGMRDFCGMSIGSEQAVHVLNLDINAAKLSSKGRSYPDPLCAASQLNWVKQFCESDYPTAVSSHGFPEQLSVYSPTEFDHKKMLVNAHGAYSTFVKDREQKAAEGKPLEVTETKEFSHYPKFNNYSDDYWIARDDSWKNDAGEPFTLECHETPPSNYGMVYCTTTYRLKSGPQVTYRFRAKQDELAATTKTIDANLHALIESLQNNSPETHGAANGQTGQPGHAHAISK